MADKIPPTQPAPNTVVTSVPPASSATPPVTKAPMYWRAELRPNLIVVNDDRLSQIHFDANFAGAKFAGKWEDEWPMLTKDQFQQALIDVSKLEIGGQWADGTHFTNDARGAPVRAVAKE